MLPRHTPTQKSFLYYELQDFLGQDGCPICALLLKSSLTALDSLLYEQVTDPEARTRLLATRGFCNWHAWMLLRIPAGRSGVAIIYETLLGHQIQAYRALRRALPSHSFWQRLRWRWRSSAARHVLQNCLRKAPCPLCSQQQRADEHAYLLAFLDALAEPAFVERFQGAFGLCLPHVAQACTEAHHHPLLPALIQHQTDKLEALRARLQTIIRTFDYRFAAELSADAGPEWQRTIEMFVGKPEVFGNERRGHPHEG